jgi:tetratricopeptide (TPR) repeat protein
MLSRLYVLTGKTQEALAEARRGIAAAPRNMAGLMLTAVLESGEGDTRAAAKHYEEALAIDNGFVPALNNLAYILADERRNLDRAMDLGMRARQFAPENPFVADTVGWVAYRRGDYPWAYAMIREGAEVLSANPEVLYHLGMAQAAIGREQEAADSLGKALSAKGTFSGRDEAAALLDVLKLSLDEAKDADRDVIETMLRHDRNSAPALCRLARIDERDGKLTSARSRLIEARKSNPHYLPAVVSLARISDRLGDREKAIELAREAQSKAGEDIEIKGMLGWLAYRGGQHEWAAGLLREVAASAPGNSTVQYRYGLTQLALGRIADARTFIGRALAKDPAFADAGAAGRTLNLLALAEGDSSSQQDLEMAKAAVSDDPAGVAGMYAMASILRRQGQREASEDAMERLLAAYPNFAPAAIGLAASYLDRGQKLDRAYTLAAQAGRLMPNNCGGARSARTFLSR